MAGSATTKGKRRARGLVLGLLGVADGAQLFAGRYPPLAVASRKAVIDAELGEIEVAERRFSLTERRTNLIWRSIFLVITVLLIGLTVYCYLEGGHPRVPIVTGAGGLGTAVASYFSGRGQRVDR